MPIITNRIIRPLARIPNILRVKLHGLLYRRQYPQRLKADTAVLFCSHRFNPSIVTEFEKIRADCQKDRRVVMAYDYENFDLDPNPDWEYHLLNYMDICRAYSYKPREKKFWINCEYAVLDFYLKNPGHSYYWRVEYDVRFSGDWSSFFASFDDNDADFLALRLCTPDQAPDWPWWDIIEPPVPRDQKRGSFFPVQRFSNRALRLLDEKYRSGCHGMSEVVVPTLLNVAGYKVEDIGRQWYDDTTVIYQGRVAYKPNMLTHPVKE